MPPHRRSADPTGADAAATASAGDEPADKPTTALAETTAAAAAGRLQPCPLTLAYGAALARRGARRGPGVQQALQQRVRAAAAMAQFSAARSSAARASTADPGGHADAAQPAAADSRRPGPLARLLHDAEQRLAHLPAADAPSAPGGPHQAGAEPLFNPAGTASGLQGLRQAGPTWARLRVQQQLRQSLAKAPEQAGPLNSHSLVLRTLQALQALSPSYLLRFMDQMDGLFALEHRLQQGVQARHEPRQAQALRPAATAAASAHPAPASPAKPPRRAWRT